MAEKKPAPPPVKGGGMERDNRDRKAAPPAKKRSRGLLKFAAALAILLMLAGSAVAAGIYFKLIDVAGLAQKYKLNEYPVVGKYFPQPRTNFATVDLPPETGAAKDTPPPQTEAQAAPASTPVPAPLPPAATAEDIKANLDKAKKEEAKRISRLARLYGEMKPDEAVPILNKLDDATVVAILSKMEDSQVAGIMAQFTPDRAARLTQDMLKGKTAM